MAHECKNNGRPYRSWEKYGFSKYFYKIFKEARSKGDTATMKRAIGYANKFVGKAEEYKTQADEVTRQDAKEEREKAKSEREKTIEKRRAERQKFNLYLIKLAHYRKPQLQIQHPVLVPCRNASTHLFHQLFRDGKSESGSCFGIFHSIESVKQPPGLYRIQ